MIYCKINGSMNNNMHKYMYKKRKMNMRMFVNNVVMTDYVEEITEKWNVMCIEKSADVIKGEE